MFGFGKKQRIEPYDKSSQKPVIRASICTGEKVAGFKEIQTGKFHDIMVIRNDSDLQAFMKKYDVAYEDIVKEY